jgi:hypothetical protein
MFYMWCKAMWQWCTDSSSSISAGDECADCTQADFFLLLVMHVIRVIPTRLTHVLSESAALQQYAVGQDLRRSRYRATVASV